MTRGDKVAAIGFPPRLESMMTAVYRPSVTFDVKLKNQKDKREDNIDDSDWLPFCGMRQEASFA